MRKISFGSFPLVEVRKEDRRCLDQYLIKTFSDNISISDAIRNLSVTKNLLYITPDAIMKNWLGGNFEAGNNRVDVGDRTSSTLYDQALKRAFYILKEFYKKVKTYPFYKEYIFYPIYVEKIDKIDVGGRSDIDEQYTEVQMNYNFIVLSNDLTKNLKIDEIRYDENASLNFLFLFVEFFANSGKSIHDYRKSDHEFLIKLYQFIEHSGKDPIHMTMDLYKLLGMVKDIVNNKKTVGGSELGKTIKKEINSKILLKYRGMLKHRFLDLMSKQTTGPARPEDLQEAFIKIMNAIFKTEDLQGLYDGVDSSADFNERMRYLYNTNKYKEILNLSEELIKYNQLKCDDVVTVDPMEFDFKIERGEHTIETNTKLIAQKYQTFFKDYVESIAQYLSGVIEELFNKLNISATINNTISANLTTNTNELNILESGIETNERVLAGLNDNLKRESRLLTAAADAARNGNTIAAQEYTTRNRNVQTLERQIRDLENDISRMSEERKQRETLLTQLLNIQQTVSKAITDTNSQLYQKIQDKILSAIATDLTFIYDDGKRFFENESLAEGFLDLVKDPTYNILAADGSGFIKAIADQKGKTIKPKIKRSSSEIEVDNPKYFAAEVLSALKDSFDATAKDAIMTLRDSIKPAISEVLASTKQPEVKLNPFSNGLDSTDKLFITLLSTLEDSISKRTDSGFDSSYEKFLAENILRNRFISKVLRNFNKMLTVRKIDKIIEFDKNISQLHPLIKKLINKNSGSGRDCQYFKSFIISLELCEQLYKIKYIIDTHKFTKGLINTPPRKASNPMNRIQTVLFDYLGLKDNPVWILSKNDVYLSMPDDLSLTNSSILSRIPKSELKDVCRISASDYWTQKNMGTIAKFGDPKIARWHQQISSERERISNWQIEKNNLSSNDKDQRKKLNNYIDAAQKKIRELEEKISKSKHDEKIYDPQGFIFGSGDFDDANRAENEPLLTDTEKAELQKNKENLRKKLQELNPFDDKEVEEMEKKLEKAGDHPFDLIDFDNKDNKNRKEVENAEKELSDFEKFMNMREEFFNKEKK